MQEDKEAVHPFLNQIDRIEEEVKRLKDEVVDSDNEYVKDSNYTGIKQVRKSSLYIYPYIQTLTLTIGAPYLYSTIYVFSDMFKAKPYESPKIYNSNFTKTISAYSRQY